MREDEREDTVQIREQTQTGKRQTDSVAKRGSTQEEKKTYIRVINTRKNKPHLIHPFP